MDFCFSSLGRSTYYELERHCISSGVWWIGKVLSRVSIVGFKFCFKLEEGSSYGESRACLVCEAW